MEVPATMEFICFDKNKWNLEMRKIDKLYADRARLIEELTKCEIHFSLLSDPFSSERFNSIQKLLAEMK